MLKQRGKTSSILYLRPQVISSRHILATAAAGDRGAMCQLRGLLNNLPSLDRRSQQQWPQQNPPMELSPVKP